MNGSANSKSDTVKFWRRRMLSLLARCYLGLAMIAALAGISVAIINDGWAIVVFDGVALLVGVGLVLCPDRFYGFKAAALIALTFVVGVFFTYYFGPFAAGPLWLFAGPMLSAALFGWRKALASLGFLVLILVVIGSLLAGGLLDWSDELSLGNWFVIGGSLVGLCGLLSISIGVLLDGVARANQEREDAIESRELLEQQLHHAQKMQALGRLAGGIAHDFNNLLVGISGFTEFAMERAKDNPPIIADLSEVMNTVTRAKGLTEQLLTFSRKNPEAPRQIDLNDCIRETSRLIEQLSGDKIQVRTKLCAEPCTTRIDPDSFVQILVNAALNAADAMPDGGEFTIETAHLQVGLSQPSPDGLDMDAGGYITVSISDTGVGMDQGTLEKVFEPFFTTKGVGEGTGLGLSTCWSVMNQVGGHLHMSSNPGLGSTLKCFFHVTAWVPSESGQIKPGSAVGGSETLLVVEDDEHVRRTFTRALSAMGYEVLEASDCADALVIAQKPYLQIDLLITDVVMPGKNGLELAEMVTALHPGLAVLYVSGYSDEALTQKGIFDVGMKLLKKPFQLDDLCQEVRETLNAHH